MGSPHRPPGRTTRSSGRTPARSRASTGSPPTAAPTGSPTTTGLPLATYFSASKIAWILDNVPGARAAAEAGDLLFGTPDTWVVWNLTGGARGGIHVTDVTNASRTLLMDLRTLDWSDELLEVWGIPRSMMPEIRSSSECRRRGARAAARLDGIPIAGILGDQQAATFGQAAFDPGESKNTYGTGNFLLVNTGTEIVRSGTASSRPSRTGAATSPRATRSRARSR